MTKMILGDACEANQYLNSLRENLRETGQFGHWKPVHWKAFIWTLHVAYRVFMSKGKILPMSFLASEIEARKMPDESILPPAM
jgi:hypothetical protein